MVAYKVASKGMHGGQSDIAGRDAVPALSLQEGEEATDPISSDVSQFKGFDWPSAVLGSKPQEQNHAVTIALNRVATHVA